MMMMMMMMVASLSIILQTAGGDSQRLSVDAVLSFKYGSCWSQLAVAG
jgi:hypothetical protein